METPPVLVACYRVTGGFPFSFALSLTRGTPKGRKVAPSIGKAPHLP